VVSSLILQLTILTMTQALQVHRIHFMELGALYFSTPIVFMMELVLTTIAASEDLAALNKMIAS